MSRMFFVITGINVYILFIQSTVAPTHDAFAEIFNSHFRAISKVFTEYDNKPLGKLIAFIICGNGIEKSQEITEKISLKEYEEGVKVGEVRARGKKPAQPRTTASTISTTTTSKEPQIRVACR